MSVEVPNGVENMTVRDKSIIVQDAHKRYSEIISMRGLNMSVPLGSMYVYQYLYGPIKFLMLSNTGNAVRL